jgi:CDP-glucose 4,6-dehydratase
LLLAEKQYENKARYEGNYNFGPDERDCITTGRLTDLFCEAWGNDQKWETQHDGAYHEANFLRLDCAKSKSVLGWAPKWGIREAVEKTVECGKLYRDEESVCACVNAQIEQYSTQEV